MVILKISERLKSIGNFVPKDWVTVDVGTDHGYLLKYLLDTGKIKKGYGFDLNKKPLTYAERNLKEYLENNNAELRMGDGLNPLKDSDNADCIVIAGMGGHLMTEILENGKEKLSNIKRIILAPNVSWEKLRRYLTTNGWKIIDEELVLEDNKFYPIIVFEKGESDELSSGELFFGPCLIKKNHTLLKKFAEHEKNKFLKNISRMKESKKMETRIEIEKLLNKWEEMSRCLNEY